MRICLVIEAGGGGAGRHVIDLAGGFGRRGHDVHLIYSAVRAEARYLAEIAALPVTAQAVEMHRSLGLHDLASARAVGCAIRAAGPFDIVHGHSSKGGAMVRMADAGGARRVYTPHAFRGLDPGNGLAARLLYNGAEMAFGALRTDALIAVSREEMEFAARWRIAPGRCHLIRNGVVRTPDVTRGAARGALGLADGELAVGFVGRLSYQKAPERFVEAMARVMRRVPQVRGVILGDGENAAAVERDLDRSGLRDRFIWHRASRAQDVMPAFDAVMMTSRYEGLSYVLLESLAAGVPIVTTQVAGVQDVFGDGGCGMAVPGEGDVVGALEQAALRMCEDAALRARMADAAVRRSGELNGPRMIDETERLYRRLLATKG